MNSYNQVTPTAFGQSSSAGSVMSSNSHSTAATNTSTGSAQPPQQQPQTQAQQPQLPPSLTAFVQACHSKAAQRGFNAQQLGQMQMELKTLLEEANREGKIWYNHWHKQQLPCLAGPHARLELVCNMPRKSTIDRMEKQKQKVAKAGTKRSKTELADDEMTSNERKRARAERFERELSHREDTPLSINEEEYKFDKNQPIRGTCQALEKSYLRLTSAPDPTKVRPQAILVQAFKRLMTKYTEGAKYTYVCDQFKAIRQDLTVQLIEDEFTVKVYEAHARIAIENQDLGEFNQCQSMLQKLYQLPHITNSTNKLEFMSYGILYCLFTKNYDTITAIKLRLSDKERQNSFIAPALEIMRAKISNNYHKMFILFSKTKGTTKKLLNCFINRERVRALSVMCTAYKIINLEFLLQEFHFQEEADCMQFILEHQIEQFIELKGENVYLNTANARSTVMQHLQQSKKVDIKGQV